jgi:hypothetical protein
MNAWTLTVLLDSELESCGFATVRELKTALRSLLSDYGNRLGRAIVTDPAGRQKSLALKRTKGRQERPGNSLLTNCFVTPEPAK